MPPARPDIIAAASRLPAAPVTRFAPSPTGYLHLGHVVNAIYVWGVARVLGGSVIVRIEDHDRSRSRPEYERAILEDLAWLGFTGDSRDGAPHEPTRQRERLHRYEAAQESLRQSHHVYACDCSRARIGGERYSGRCRTRRVAEGLGRGLRVTFGPGLERFDDLLLGPMEQSPADQCGDLLIRDRQGQWTYQFAVTVDDWIHEVDLVVRGEDLLPSTGRQIRLGKLLGREKAALFLHHPLIRDDAGAKLSKKEASAPIREMRRRGVPAQQVLGTAAQRVGLTAGDAPQEREALLELTAKRLREDCAWPPDYSASNFTPSINRTPKTTKAT